MARRELAAGDGITAPADEHATPARPDDEGTAAQSLRAALRHATADLHRRLDRAPDQRALLAQGLTLGRYTTIMARHRHALALGEAVLASLDPARPSGLPPYRPRLPALDADLAILDAAVGAAGRPTAQPGSCDGPESEPVPATDSPAARGRYLGTRYVLEGSTLGAAVIARRLERHLPALSEGGFAYWRVQAEEAPAWGALAGSLAALPSRGELACAAVAAACDTFVVFLRAFGVDLPEPRRRLVADGDA